ncbi:DNA polymerase III subunit epsilon [Corynebacterium genitalium ATCC 33030]|uniref:Exonuclease n=1 Tax=Corynebacterium genitalium ATCC 33030 TaxID=585529 RepID=D7WAE7_9CORY|nr:MULTISPECIES: exonuclease domain-containing protein [Corynebacterium]EFK54828.1 exonuclease [Corynebacterium genitalium ATCC 33030]MCQ4622295.1 DNA polymerase III subunit epsilon [Corynebacterium sp. CCUG 70398]UUA89873.1 DNA polymerase III subunit epsilon [Corynebacterium genitalium ATCC 33030]
MSPHPGFAVIDVVTTGFGGSDRIVEVGVVLLDQQLREQGTWETLVQPNRDIATCHVHKLTATHLKNAPTWEEVAPELAQVIRGRIGVAHNASFEKRFLSKEFCRVGIATNVGEAHWVDTKDLATAQLGCGSLADALEAAGLTNSEPHAALPNAAATAELLRTLSGTLIGVPLLFTGAMTPTNAALVTRKDLTATPPVETAETTKLNGLNGTAKPDETAEHTEHTEHTETAESNELGDEENWLARLIQSLPAGGDTDTDQYSELLRVCLGDRHLTPAEFYGLARFAHDTGLTEEDVAKIHEEFIRQIASKAWVDGVITEREKTELCTLAEQLAVDPALVHELIATPQMDNDHDEEWVELIPHDRIAFTGSMDVSREEWRTRALSHGLTVGGVGQNTALLVAANPDTMSRKARRARELNIPIVSELHFSRLLASMETEQPQDQPASPADAPDEPLASADPGPDDATESETEAEIGKELDILAGWLTLTGTELPRGVRGLAPGVEKRMAGDAIAGLFARCVEELAAACADDPMKMTMISMHYMGDTTLEELGELYNISQKRIQQLDAEIRHDVVGTTALSTDVAHHLAARFLPLSATASVNAQLPALAMDAEPFTGTYEHYFRMWGLWDTDETWIAAPGFANAVDAALAELVDEHNAALISAAAESLGTDRDLLAEWMSQRNGLVVLSDDAHVLIASSHQDFAAGVLSLNGEPMSTAEIAQATPMDINERFITNAVNVDERIIRVASDLYGLREWGLEAYAGGADSVLHDHSDATGDSDTSRGETTEVDPQDDPDLYWRDDAWCMLLTVNHDHLGGSGFSLPLGVASIYGVPAGGEVAVPSRLGDQFVGVNAAEQSDTSTIRRFLLEAEVSVGDRVWLRFAPEEFAVFPAPARAFPADDAVVDLAHLLDSMGLDPALAGNSESALAAINEALHLEPTTPRRRTVAVFRHRGQDEYGDLIQGL